MSKTYYCDKCKQKHVKDKEIGKKHREHEGVAPKAETEEERIKRTVNLCDACEFEPAECGEVPKFGTGKGNDNVYECWAYVEVKANSPDPSPLAEETCTICHDTGTIDLGVNARAFCKCGQETHDERIGLMPRRGDLGEARPISDDDKAEADHRRLHGGTHDAYLLGAGQPD